MGVRSGARVGIGGGKGRHRERYKGRHWGVVKCSDKREGEGEILSAEVRRV
jgi:hypothetical protein